jgi:SulP family sulfate permease
MNERDGFFTNLLAAAAIGVLQIGVAISLAALIFAGPIEAGAGRAAAGFVLGTVVVSAIVGASSKMSIVISGAQDTAAILIVAVAAAIVADTDLIAEQTLPTVIVMMAIAAVGTGVVFFAIGQFGLTSFVRFLPFPVISGFTVGTGWLLLRGGIEVMNRGEISFGELADLFTWEHGKFLVPGLGLAVMILLIIGAERLPNTLVSVAILSGSLLFHLIGRSVSNLTTIEEEGWLIGPFEQDTSWSPITPSDLADTNWSVLAGNGLGIFAIIAVSVIGLLLNLSGLEGGPDPQIDMNHEIRSAGIANVLVGATGGLVGYHLIGDTVLGRQLGAKGKFVPLAVAGMALVAFIVGPGVIALVPRAVAGGVLAGLGLNLIGGWLMQSLPQMSRTDQILSTVILVSIAGLGVLTGVLAGILVAAAVFIVKYSRTNPVRQGLRVTGRSAIDRSDRDREILTASPDAILAFQLQGYLFFGSATGVRRQVEAQTDSQATNYIIIDFSRVTGIDSTAVATLVAMSNQLEPQGVTTLWSGANAEVADELQRGHNDLPDHHVDLDHAVAWCEDQILAANTDQITDGSSPPTSKLFNPQVIEALGLTTQDIAPGDTLITAGDVDSDVYFVESGTFTAWVETDTGQLVRIRQMLPGAVLGEVAFSTGAARTATVIADTPGTVRILRRKDFDRLVERHPKLAIELQQELLQRMGSRMSSNAAMVRDLLR